MAALTSTIFTITLTATSWTKLVEEAEKFVNEARSSVETIVTTAKDVVSAEADPFEMPESTVVVVDKPTEIEEPKQNNLPTCVHGEMKHRSGISKAGKEYDGFYCIAREFSEQCDPVFPSQLKKKKATLSADVPVDWKNETNQL
jgi:hypothetical protein